MEPFASPTRGFVTLCRIDASAGAEYHFQQSLTKGAAMFYENQLLPTLLQRGRITGMSLELKLPSGEQVPVFANAVLHGQAEGHPAGIFLVLFDATESQAL